VQLNDSEDDGVDNEPNPFNTKVESLCDVPFLTKVLDTSIQESHNDYNLLIPQLHVLFYFISDNKEEFTTNQGRACNVFWRCSNNQCTGSGNVLAKASTKEASRKFWQRHPELPVALSDYNINRQVVLAC
jgi:hypothetical protein